MTSFAQGLMTAAYAMLGLAAWLILPRISGLSSEFAFTIGVVIFFGALQIHSILQTGRRAEDQSLRVSEVEDKARFLRKDLERMRRDVQRVHEPAGAVSNQELVSELKILHTLLDQVMRRQKAYEASPKQTASETPALQDRPLDLDDVRAPAHDAELVPVEPKPLVAIRDDDQALEPTPHATKEEHLLAIIQSALSENRVDLYLQPIVSLPARRVVHFECYSRVRDENGTVIEPSEYLDLAASRGLLGTLDNLLLFRLIQLLRRLGPRRPDIRFFCNMARNSLEDEEFFPQFMDFMLANRSFADRLIFEIAHSDFEHLSGPVRDSLGTLRRQGFSFSLDRIPALDGIDRTMLAEEGFSFVKADHGSITDSLRPEDISIFASSFKSRGLNLVAARVETEEQVIPLVDGDVELAQGYVFGMPGQVSSYNREL